MSITHQVYTYVKNIPAGKVTTYGSIARAIKTSPRVVGSALHKNPDPTSIPCHRVVNSRGALAQNFAFGGKEGQQLKLEKEGVVITNGQVNLSLYSLTKAP